MKSTFVDVKEGRDLKEICHDLRKCKSDTCCASTEREQLVWENSCHDSRRKESSLFDILEEAYMPGKFSDEQETLAPPQPSFAVS